MHQLFQYILHIDTYLLSFVAHYGVWTYLVLFLVIFCETGLVITPFLPGDSLLFVAGSLTAGEQPTLDLSLLLLLLILASCLGNKLNYLIGRFIGPNVFKAEKIWLFNKKHLIEAHQFYEKHGGKTIIFARFIPIIRTFVPFVAGVGYMNLRSFTFFNIVSAMLWIGTLVGAGYFFGSLPFVRDHFSFVIYSIITLSLLPPVLTYCYRRVSSSI